MILSSALPVGMLGLMQTNFIHSDNFVQSEAETDTSSVARKLSRATFSRWRRLSFGGNFALRVVEYKKKAWEKLCEARRLPFIEPSPAGEGGPATAPVDEV